MPPQDQDERPQVASPDPEELQSAFEDAASQDPGDSIQRRKRREYKAKRKKVSNARSSLLVVVALFGIAALIYGSLGLANQNPELLIEGIVYFVLAAANVGLYAWARRQPYPALLTGLIVLAVLWAMDLALAMAFDPSSMLRGALVRFIIVLFLVRGLIAAKGLRRPASPSDRAAH